MKMTWRIFRTFVLCLTFVLIALPVSLFIILSTEWAQNDIRKVAINEISALLGTEISLGKIEIHPFNQLSIHDVEAIDDNGRPALHVDEISIAFELTHLLRTGKLIVNYALVDGANLNLYKVSKDAPLNIAQILNRLKSDKNERPRSNYDLSVNTVLIRHGAVDFNILDAQPLDSIFDKNHISVSDIFVNAYIPRISNEEYRVEIDHLSFIEKNGITLTDLKADAEITPNGSTLHHLSLKFPHSEIAFSPITLKNHGLSEIETTLQSESLKIGIKPGSIIYPPDFQSFATPLKALNDSIEILANGSISSDCIYLERLAFSQVAGNYVATLSGKVENIKQGLNATYNLDGLRTSANSHGIESLCRLLPDKLSKPFLKSISPLKSDATFSANIEASGKISNSKITIRSAALGNSIALNCRYFSTDSFKTINFKTEGTLDFSNIQSLFGAKSPSKFSSILLAEGRFGRNTKKMDISLDSAFVDFLDHKYHPLSTKLSIDDNKYDICISVADSLLALNAECSAETFGKNNLISGSFEISNFAPHRLSLIDKYPDYNLSLSASTSLEFSSIDDISGYLTIFDVNFSDKLSNTPDLKLKTLTIESSPVDEDPTLIINSDFLNAQVTGPFRLSSLTHDLINMVETVLPALNSSNNQLVDFNHFDTSNDFNYSIDIAECEQICRFFNSPISIIYPINIDGHVFASEVSASFNLNAPYILQGDKIIENTTLKANINGTKDNAEVYFSSKIPTKKGPLTAIAKFGAASDNINSSIHWNIDRKIPINGALNFTTHLSRDYNNKLSTAINVQPGSITFGNEIWNISPSAITIEDECYSIRHFGLSSDDKSIAIDGIVSKDDDSDLSIHLSKITLLDIFETLEIDKALIGGTATGDFTGHALLSPEPIIYSDNLHVDNISYNRCVLGDADIQARWDNEKKSFNLNADVTGETGLHSRIFGDIIPAGEGLDINFDVNHVPVGFMKPFMEAFAADLKGYASGKARLFGTFKYIDMEGDIFADDLKIKIAFTNTWYSATDSIKLRPGIIDVNNVTIRDINGNIALLNGVVRHKFFKEPSFNFSVKNARNFLSYDVDSRLSPDWYGTIYGNGGATISGEPGVVNIGVNMSTAPKSTFTFVLSDRLDADEYSFITFKDSRAEAHRDSLMKADNVPTVVRQLRERLGNEDSSSSSAYNMDLQIDITPDARMTMVMDPVGGDEIKATGSGNLRMTYGSLNNDLKMYGTYTLNRGSYNFTLQDIIIKDFTIKEGSSIAFHGDPYSAQLNIQAVYGVNANLSDLDESFLLDKDLNRTNVPVHALLKVTGDMRQPDIDFDLEFPTLTQDTYRKVKSIVSTKDMMNRQIIYLLALNRFYTPDYMASTTKGNELFSVASSTISSQLSSMLGKLSDDWSIAPNLRSDRGDFSDVEVDVALSSRLLNNRLLFNGNFGYRDKTLNTNQFIGDFDIEYLLNPKGSWRLKAYNRYNDQNYYVRTAQTTQGIGLVFKKDFDNLFGFLRPKKKVKTTDETPSQQSPVIAIPDSIANPANLLPQ